MRQTPDQALVLDIGCGLGALAEYAVASGVARRWVGIEQRSQFAAASRENGHYEQVLEAAFEEVPPQRVDAAIAIGLLAGETATPLSALWQFVQLAPRSLFTVLSREALAGRPVLAAEHGRNAHTFEDLQQHCPGAQIVDVTLTDFAVVSSPEHAELRTTAQRYQATLAGPWGGAPEAEKAWLACELGLREEAERWLDGCEPGGLADVVRERLRLR